MICADLDNERSQLGVPFCRGASCPPRGAGGGSLPRHDRVGRVRRVRWRPGPSVDGDQALGGAPDAERGARLRDLLVRSTVNPSRVTATGSLAGAVLQSTNGVTLMLVSFVSAGHPRDDRAAALLFTGIVRCASLPPRGRALRRASPPGRRHDALRRGRGQRHSHCRRRPEPLARLCPLRPDRRFPLRARRAVFGDHNDHRRHRRLFSLNASPVSNVRAGT